MKDNTNPCEKLEMAVFSGEKLSDELNNHAKNCEHCRKFLEQNEKLEDDLKKLNVAGFEEGKITEAVMAKVRAEKKKSSLKFNLTHHMGTAAAIVIICAAALMVKNNPSDEPELVKAEREETEREIVLAQIHSVDKTDTKQPVDGGVTLYITDCAENDDGFECIPEEDLCETESLGGGLSEPSSEDTADYKHSYCSPMSVTVPDEEQEYYDDSFAGEKMLKSYKPSETQAVTTDEAAAEEIPEAEITQDTVGYDTAPEEAVTEETAVEEAVIEETAAEEAAPQVENGAVQDLTAGSLGGGSSVLARNEAECETEVDVYADDYLVFEGLEFLQGEENLEKNVSIANARLALLYGEDFCVIDGYCLVHNGWGGNGFFFETAPDVTYSFIKSLEGSSRTITGK